MKLEGTASICSIQQLEGMINQLEQLMETNPKIVREQLGEQLAAWELFVRRTSSISLSIRIGELLEKQRLHWLALSWLQWALRSAQAANEDEWMAKALRLRGRVHSRLGMYEEALDDLLRTEARLISVGSRNPEELPVLWQNIASVYANMKKFDLALAYAERAGESFRQLGDLHKQSILELMTGTYLSCLHRYPESYELLVHAREGLEQFQDYFHLARCWHNYGELMWEWGRQEEAIASWRMSLEMKKKNNDLEGQVNTLLSIVDYLSCQQDWHGALRYTTQAFAICHQHQLYDQEIKCLDRWSNILFALGKYQDLEVCASRAMRLAKCVTAENKIGSLFQKISDYCKQVGWRDYSEQYNRKAVQIIG